MPILTGASIENLTQFSAKYLPQVIDALPTPATQQKALEIVTHVKKRLSSRKEVKLPINALLDQYETTNQNPVKTFAMLFIQMGLGRVDKVVVV